MTRIAVIIARGGSKGLPGKNLKPLGDKPLVAWTIEHALASKQPDAVVLTSDSEAILDVGRAYDMKTYLRPAGRASDVATVDDAARHGVECWEAETGKRIQYCAILYGNVAIRPADLTDRAFTKLIETEADSVQSVYPVGKMHPLWMKKLSGTFNDVLEMYEDNTIYRRQDLPPVYMLDGGVLAMTRTSLFDKLDPDQPHAFLGEDRRAIVSPEGSVVDIDSPVDLMFAEAVLAARRAETG